MIKNSFLLLFSILLWLTACTTATPTPKPMETVVIDVVVETAVSPTTSPSVTPSPTASQTPLPAPTATPTLPPNPTLQPTDIPQLPTAISLPPVDPNEEIEWADTVQLIQQFVGYQMEWSPSRDEFVYITDLQDGDYQVRFAKVQNFQPINITPIDFARNPQILWHPLGEYLFLTDGWINEGLLSWKIIRTDMSAVALEQSGYYTHWLNNELAIKQQHIGPGWVSISIINTTTDQSLNWSSFDGYVKGISQNYVMLTQERGNSYNTSAAILAQSVINPAYEESEYGTYLKFLLSNIDEKSQQQPFNRFTDILPHTDNMLVVTWRDEINHHTDLISGAIVADLQLWNTETNTLTMVMSGGIHGHYSPDGNYLAYLTPNENLPQLHLLDQTTGEILLSQTVFVESDYQNTEIDAFITFSPNGRYLTFFRSDQNLMIYDLESNLFLELLTAIPVTPIWSPDSSRFVYQEREIGLSIFDIRTETAYPLAVSGNRRLSEPQWSYDGTYLSVTVATESGRETAVLQIP